MNEDTYKKIFDLQKDIEQKRNEIVALRQQMPLEEVGDYTLKDHSGHDVKLSSLFDERNELMVIHNMGKRCVYCTLWADGLNGFYLPLTDRAPWVVVSPDEPKIQKEFAESRGWKFKMLSGHDSTFIKDMGFEKEDHKYWPGVSAFVRKEGKIYRASYDYFGPGDTYCSVWHLMDLFPSRDNGWEPKYKYN
jgi:predicted dithiol-disulfide oxidoreductase (DUF899 family)